MSAPAPSMYSPASTETAKSLGLKHGRPNLEGYFRAFELEHAGEVRGYH